MAQHDNLQLARQAFEAWNKHDVERYVRLLDEKHVFESDTIPAPMPGREAGRQFMQIYVSAFPDLHFDIDQMLGEGDFVVTRWTAKGTHRGELMGIKPTNRRTITHGCTVVQIKSGKLVHDWIYWDTGHLLRQLGVLPAA
ncbi:MAG: hypothetical protein DMD87_28910 [Candidatus Rokuibacteriota bacterium]|nr:MAG: hypothetical protein DMD87_28910 [Candidatus Rokubacteria bacterium]